MRLVSFILLSVLITATAAAAQTTTACHCFRQMEYDPSHPTAADDYFLASAQNTLYAAVSGMARKTVVRSKMAGADSAELWVVWALAQGSAERRGAIEKQRKSGMEWHRIVELLRVESRQVPRAVMSELLRGSDTGTIAARVVDAVLVQQCGVDEVVVRQLRSAGAGDRETILAAVLAARSRKPAGEIWAAVREGRHGWSEQLDASGVTAENLEQQVRGMVRQ